MRFSPALLVSGALALAIPTAALCRSTPYTMHVVVRDGADRHGVSVDVPWSVKRGGDPFSFCHHSDGITHEQLRSAWATLKASPEGRVVTFRDHGKPVEATRLGDNLVLRVTDDDRPYKHTRIKLPGFIVESVLASPTGELRDEDIAAAVNRKGSIDLVQVDGTDGSVRVTVDRTRDTD